MIIVCKQNNETVINKIKNRQIDSARWRFSNFVDDIVLAMNYKGILCHFDKELDDKRKNNISVLLKPIQASAIAAKMKNSNKFKRMSGLC